MMPTSRTLRLLALMTAVMTPVTGAEPLAVRGTILGEDSSPLADAGIRLLAVPGNFDSVSQLLAGRLPARPMAEARSDRDGRFVVAAPGSGVYQVLVEARGHIAMRYPVLPVTGAVDLLPVALLRDAGGVLRVVDRAGRPVAGAAVLAGGVNRARWQRVESGGWHLLPRIRWTDSDGRAAMSRARGERLEVEVWTPGSVAPGNGELVKEATLKVGRPAGTGRAVEVRGVRGEPVSSAVVAVGRRVWPRGRTDAEGRWTLPAGGSGRQWLHVFSADGRFLSIEAAVTGDGPVRIVLPGLASRAGVVRDAASHGPVAGALVWSPRDPAVFARSDAEGRFSLRLPAGDRLRLRAVAEGYLAADESIDAGTAGSLSLALRPAAALEGRVVDGGGTPLPGIRLSIHRRDETGLPPERPEAAAVSDRRGRFRFARLAPAAGYLLAAEGPAVATEELQVRGLRPGEALLGLEVVLRRGRPATGRVVDLEERPLAGVEVRVVESGPGAPAPAWGGGGDRDPFRAVSDAEGRFGLRDVPAARIDILARRAGYAPFAVRGVELPPGRRPVGLGTLILEPGVALLGRVVDPDDRPVAAAEVWAAPAGERAFDAGAVDGGEPETRTAENGSFELVDLAPGARLDLKVDAAGYLPSVSRGVAAPAAEPVTVVLRHAASVHGRVERADGTPLAGAAVRARPVAEGGEDLTEISTLAAEDGSFELADLAPGAVAVEAWARGFQPSEPLPLELEARQRVEAVVFVLEPGAALEGFVSTLDGEPIPAARVLVGRAAATAEPDGRYRVAGIPPGRREVEVRHPDYNRLTRDLEIELGDNRADFELAGGHPVTGRVLDAEDLPVADAGVALEGGDGHSYLATTDADGAFRFPRVADGVYTLQASKTGFAPAELAGGLEIAGLEVEDVELRLLAGAVIEGELLGLTFEEMARARVEARRRGGAARPGTVDYEGGYRVSDLAAGDWRVRAWLDGGSRQAEARVVLEPETGRVRRDLEFGRGFALTGQVVHRGQALDGANLRLRGFDIAADRSVATDREGRFRLEDLKRGSYRLELSDRRRILVHNQDLALYEETELTIEVATVRLSGTVVSAATGEGLADALILLKQYLGERTDQGSLFSAGSDSRGAYSFDRLTAGRYRLTVRRDGYQPFERFLDLPAGAAHDGLRLALEATEGLGIAVRLRSGPVPRTLTLAAYDAAGRQVLTETRVLDAAGFARFSTLPPGTWSLLASAPGSATVRAVVQVPGEPVELILPDAGRLRVRVAELAESDRVASLSIGSQDGLPFRHLEAGGLLRDSWPVIGGQATVEGLPPGLWTLRAVAPDGVAWTGSAVTTGGPDIEVRLD